MHLHTKPSRPRKGLRRGRAFLLTALAASAVSAVAAGSALAVPFSQNLNYGYANIGPGITGTTLLNGSGPAATFSGDVNAGAITAGDLTMPNKVFNGAALGLGAGSTITVNLDESAPVTGTLNTANGQLDLNAATYDIQAVIAGAATPIVNGQCDFTVSLAPSTENAAPYSGRRFNNPGPGYSATSPGSVSTPNSPLAGGAGPNVPTCVALSAGGVAPPNNIAVWLGQDSIPSNGVPWTQSYEFGELNVGLATRLTVVDPAFPVYVIGTIAGTPVAMATDPTPVTATTSVPTTATTYGNTTPGFYFKPYPGSFAGLTLTTSLQMTGVGPTTGTYNAKTGAETSGNDTALDGNGDYTATIDIASPMSTCSIPSFPLGLSTAKNAGGFDPSPLAGQNFAGIGGNGAMATNWPSLPAATPNTGACATLNGAAVTQPGGLWFSHGIDSDAGGGGGGGGGGTTTAPASAPTGSTTTKKKCKKKQKLKKGKCVKKKKKKKKKK